MRETYGGLTLFSMWKKTHGESLWPANVLRISQLHQCIFQWAINSCGRSEGSTVSIRRAALLDGEILGCEGWGLGDLGDHGWMYILCGQYLWRPQDAAATATEE